MGSLERLKELSSQMDYEPAEDTHCPQPANTCRTSESLNVSNALMPNGKHIALLKTLLSSACERNCNYCAFRSGRDFKRVQMSPDEMAQSFILAHRAGIVQGLFLSSGVAGSCVRSQDNLIAAAEILRQRYHFAGYIHLKLMPGSEYAQVERSMQLANRVSLNLEAPNLSRLEKLAPRKAFIGELLQPLKWVDEIRRTQPAYKGFNGRWPSMTTQFVVGAVDETDLELLSTTASLQHELNLGRAYFSAFRPVTDTPFENMPPTPPIRQHRLYQASFLLRDYGFDLEDLPFEPASGNLPLTIDPKLAWARQNLADRPLELNRADLHDLLRLPGIGPRKADAILRARRKGLFHSTALLSSLGIDLSRLSPFILIDGKRQINQQLSLWPIG
jgi:predicted DNA-binding helix-hairpin-helix protein